MRELASGGQCKRHRADDRRRRQQRPIKAPAATDRRRDHAAHRPRPQCRRRLRSPAPLGRGSYFAAAVLRAAFFAAALRAGAFFAAFFSAACNSASLRFDAV